MVRILLILFIIFNCLCNVIAQNDGLKLLKPDSVTKIKVTFNEDSSIMVIIKEFYQINPKDTHLILQKFYGFKEEKEDSLKNKKDENRN